jgi:hypothetical protein
MEHFGIFYGDLVYIFNGHLVNFMVIGKFYGHLVHFMANWWFSL